MEHARDAHDQVPAVADVDDCTTTSSTARPFVAATPNKVRQMLLLAESTNCIRPSWHRHMVSDDVSGEFVVRVALVVHPQTECTQFRNKIRTCFSGRKTPTLSGGNTVRVCVSGSAANKLLLIFSSRRH